MLNLSLTYIRGQDGLVIITQRLETIGLLISHTGGEGVESILNTQHFYLQLSESTHHLLRQDKMVSFFCGKYAADKRH